MGEGGETVQTHRGKMEETWAFTNISGRHDEPPAKAPLWCYGENEHNPEGSSRRSQSVQEDIMILPPSLQWLAFFCVLGPL